MNHLIQHLANDINAKRVERGLTYRELSELSDVSTSTIYKIEKREQNPTIDTLSKICSALDIDLQLGQSRT